MISMRIEVNLFVGLILGANLETVPYLTGFDLTFQKWFVSFSSVYNRKTDLKCYSPRLGDEEYFSV